MIGFTALGKRHVRAVAGFAIAAIIAAPALAACGSSGGGSSSSSSGSSSNNSSKYSPTPLNLTAAQQSAILKKAFLTDSVTAGSLNPVILQGLEYAGKTYTTAQVNKAWACQSQTTCKIGSGSQTLAYLDGSGGNLWREITRAAIALQAENYPNIGTVIYENAGGSLQTMQADLKTLIARRVTAIVTYDDFGAAMTASFQQAKNAGIPIAAFGGTPGPGAANAVVTQVQSSFCADGVQMAETTDKMLSGQGNVAFFTGTPGNPQGAGWQSCAASWFSKNAPGIKVVDKSNTSWSNSGAVAATTSLISTGKKIDAVLYDYANQTVNIVQTYQHAKQSVPDQVTWTTDNQLLQLFEQGQKSSDPWKLAGSSSINFEGNIAVTAVMDHLTGKSVASTLTFPLPFVQAQVGDYDASQPADGPGPTLMPDALLSKLLASS
ncbi:MAG: substrate-binding domain-containing protein [Actinobacteria bacterium]|nr:substrate-binding domain-containing protein [Actinomycetota bacterium]